MDGDDSASVRIRSSFGSMPSTSFVANTRAVLANSVADSSTFRAITGMNTFNSNCPWEPANATAVSLPITCAATWVAVSHSTGFTLPGMIDEPGCKSGR